MSRFLGLSPLLALGLLVPSQTVSAQDPTDPNRSNQDTPADVIGAFLDGSVEAELVETATRIVDRYLDYLAKPETTHKLAAFQKSYHDALIEQGFTEEQAFELVLRFGNPLADGLRARE